MQQISYKIYESSPEIKLFHGLYNSLKTYRLNNCFEREGFRETITPVIGTNIGLFDNNVIVSYNVDGRGRFIKISVGASCAIVSKTSRAIASVLAKSSAAPEVQIQRNGPNP